MTASKEFLFYVQKLNQLDATAALDGVNTLLKQDQCQSLYDYMITLEPDMFILRQVTCRSIDEWSFDADGLD